ncbi:hypothetical protein [Actinoallomurus iriomotensis]|nr:hypothetical protein [Actinoallomurus iriomotensis]
MRFLVFATANAHEDEDPNTGRGAWLDPGQPQPVADSEPTVEEISQ